MKKLLLLLCLVATTLVVVGCDNKPKGLTAPLVGPEAKSAAPGAPVAGIMIHRAGEAVVTAGGHPSPVPNGYYSLRWEVFAYSGFERISTVDGDATVLWSIGLAPEEGVTPLGLAFDLDGSMYTTLNRMSFAPEECWSQFARVDPQTGAVTRIGPVFPMNTCGGDIDPSGDYYVTGMGVPHLGYIHGDGFLYRFDKHTGVATQIGFTGMTDWMDMAFDSKGRLWATTQNKLYRLDTQTGAGTFVTDILGVPDAGDPHHMEVMSLAFDKRDVLYGTAMTVYWDHPDGSPVMRIDTGTGAATVLGYTHQYYNHGGDFMPARVKILHRADGHTVPMEIAIEALPEHRAHGDLVPGVDSGVPYAIATGRGQALTD